MKLSLSPQARQIIGFLLLIITMVTIGQLPTQRASRKGKREFEADEMQPTEYRVINY